MFVISSGVNFLQPTTVLKSPVSLFIMCQNVSKGLKSRRDREIGVNDDQFLKSCPVLSISGSAVRLLE